MNILMITFIFRSMYHVYACCYVVRHGGHKFRIRYDQFFFWLKISRKSGTKKLLTFWLALGDLHQRDDKTVEIISTNTKSYNEFQKCCQLSTLNLPFKLISVVTTLISFISSFFNFWNCGNCKIWTLAW